MYRLVLKWTPRCMNAGLYSCRGCWIVFLVDSGCVGLDVHAVDTHSWSRCSWYCLGLGEHIGVRSECLV